LSVLLTKSNMFIVKYFADILGVLMNAIYELGVTNIGLCIIIFSIVIYMVMMPMQIKQQKFAKMNSIMTPEIQKIQKKYANKKDQESMLKMNEETKAVYAKYGVSPSGSCLQLLIQMPILFALYQVIWKIPGYVSGIRETFNGVITKVTSIDGYASVLNNFITENNIDVSRIYWDSTADVVSNDKLVDLLYSLSPSEWEIFGKVHEFSGFSDIISNTASKIAHMQYFLGLNIADTPWELLKSSLASQTYVMVIAAVLIPFLAWITQVLNIKITQSVNNSQQQMEGTMGTTMKAMNVYMPLMSAFFCFTLPIGLGIYWIIGAVIRTLQSLGINRYMKKVDIDDLIKKNMEKVNKKRAKKGLPPQKITQQANQNVRKIQNTNQPKKTAERKVENQPSNYKKGSLASKANMVAQFNENNKKK
jgi:YidC/Oxa1 family membrane protein insertase